MDEVFKKNPKMELVKIPDFKFIDFHETQNNICYYIRKYDEFNNFDFMEAKLERTNNKVFNKYTLGAGTKINILDSFMYSYLKHRKEDVIYSNKDICYEDFIITALKENNMYNDENKERYLKWYIPKEYKLTTSYNNTIAKGYKMLYVINSPKDKAIEQHYIVFVKENKMKLLGKTIEYITFKPIQLIISLDYLKNKKGNKYLVNEFTELNIPTSILN